MHQSKVAFVVLRDCHRACLILPFLLVWCGTFIIYDFEETHLTEILSANFDMALLKPICLL